MPEIRQSVSPEIRFDCFEADFQTQELSKNGIRLRLPAGLIRMGLQST
jgi:hypothetical protein